MKKSIMTLIAAVAVTTLAVTPVMAATGSHDQFDAEIAAYLAQEQANAQIARQNKAAYDASATPLQKQVDKLIDMTMTDNAKQSAAAVAQLTALYASTPDWSSNFTLPLTHELPPRAVAIKTGYNFEESHIASGDLKPYVWVIEDGEVYGQSMNGLESVCQHGGFHEYDAYLSNPPTGGHWVNEYGGITYWGDEAEALIAARGY